MPVKPADIPCSAEPKVELVYICVLNGHHFVSQIRRFIWSYIKFPPAYQHDTVAVCNCGEVTPNVQKTFRSLPNVRFIEHDNSGQDIGGFIAAAKSSTADIQVYFGTNTHFFRPGWLKRMVEAWKKHGPGLYCAQTSFEVTPHFHSTGFWCHPKLLAAYPFPVITKKDRYNFEHGKSNLSQNINEPDMCQHRAFWKMAYKAGHKVLFAAWDGEYEWWDWRKPPNIMRRGDQTNILHWWKHSDEWFKFTSEEKVFVGKSADTNTDPNFDFVNRTIDGFRLDSALEKNLKVTLLYPHIAGLTPGFIHGKPPDLKEFEKTAERFVQTYQKFPADYKHELVIVVCHGELTDRIKAIYKNINCQFDTYTGDGWDTGAQQYMAGRVDCDFMVNMSARIHFHRRGWLERFVEARELYGDGLYGAMASLEGFPFTPLNMPNPHIRTCFYGLNPKAFSTYPFQVKTRDDTFHFESGHWNIANWFESHGKPAMMVTWDGEWRRKDWRTPQNIFRRGDQSNLLVCDHHTEIYTALTDPVAIRQHQNLANGFQHDYIPK